MKDVHQPESSTQDTPFVAPESSSSFVVPPTSDNSYGPAGSMPGFSNDHLARSRSAPYGTSTESDQTGGVAPDPGDPGGIFNSRTRGGGLLDDVPWSIKNALQPTQSQLRARQRALAP